MKHLKAIGIKFLIISIVLFSIMTIFYTASLGEILLMSLLLTGGSYLADIVLLPRIKAITAIIADFGFVFLALWFLSSVFIQTTMSVVTASLLSAVFITLSEALFHVYVREKVLKNNDTYVRSNIGTGNLQTEFAEENNVHDIKNNNNNK